jgi:uncharacterized protein YndB with AHSA1/START domain
MSGPTLRPAPVRRSIVVNADIDRSFSAFTRGIGRWWPRTHSIGSSPQADVVLEGRAGGRWYERSQDGSECEWGKVLQWEPPSRILLAWQIDGDWKYDPAFVTEVEVTFTALAARQTRVEVVHRNLERYGDKAAKIRDAVDSEGGWNGILKSYAEYAVATDPAASG